MKKGIDLITGFIAAARLKPLIDRTDRRQLKASLCAFVVNTIQFRSLHLARGSNAVRYQNRLKSCLHPLSTSLYLSFSSFQNSLDYIYSGSSLSYEQNARPLLSIENLYARLHLLNKFRCTSKSLFGFITLLLHYMNLKHLRYYSVMKYYFPTMKRNFINFCSFT